MLTRIRNQAEIRDESQIFLPERKKINPIYLIVIGKILYVSEERFKFVWNSFVFE